MDKIYTCDKCRCLIKHNPRFVENKEKFRTTDGHIWLTLVLCNHCYDQLPHNMKYKNENNRTHL